MEQGYEPRGSRPQNPRPPLHRPAPQRPQSRRGSPTDAAPALDATDLSILAELAADGRITNAALASRVGIAESTCIHRVRALRDAGVIAGIHARLDLAALGYPLQAVIKVRLGSHNREHVRSFHATLTEIPGVLTAFHVAGEDDYLLHAAVESPEALRDLILEHINVHPAVRHTETHLVFELLAGKGVLPAVTGGADRGRAGRQR
ncbi:Lrp/AsnC family transcriptional regulator [Planosporangium thailandense]|uniref:Lrp/AsnC family transcriptional regulator n=1 Tax=Planosporangium thailandense TaxID=765197 RepID=A0ABX0Y330_9ACTN|nr:Lrp/AsnC family transcriptional regulator [Planosporangium thailandense]NJC72423.1 Lrp/AsnC family transcriptional regulator [Planosporangium thailandense]